MHPQTKNSRKHKLFFLVTTLALMCQAAAMAQLTEAGRANRWEVFVGGQYWTGDDIDHSIGPTVGVGYNFSDQLNLNFEGYVGDLDVEVAGVDGVGTIYTAALNLDYNFCTGRFTPFVTAGVGVFNYDAKESFSGPSSFSVSDTGVSYGGGGGVRWEISDHWFFKAAYTVFATSTTGACLLHGPEISFGWKF